jgi:hypothetical protein
MTATVKRRLGDLRNGGEQDNQPIESGRRCCGHSDEVETCELGRARSRKGEDVRGIGALRGLLLVGRDEEVLGEMVRSGERKSTRCNLDWSWLCCRDVFMPDQALVSPRSSFDKPVCSSSSPLQLL